MDQETAEEFAGYCESVVGNHSYLLILVLVLSAVGV